jgi:hypothetical protein
MGSSGPEAQLTSLKFAESRPARPSGRASRRTTAPDDREREDARKAGPTPPTSGIRVARGQRVRRRLEALAPQHFLRQSAHAKKAAAARWRKISTDR